jgi:tetratricopeptide (TPR) repeat protein
VSTRTAAMLLLGGALVCWAPMGAAAAGAMGANAQGDTLAQASAALQAGEADKALNLLGTLPSSGPDAARTRNLLCRVRFTLEQWDAAISACQQAVKLDTGNSDYHLWLGRAYGEKASRASFLTAFSLAKQTRAEFEQAVELDPRNAAALADLGEFDRQAPAIVGGGMDKAQAIAGQLDKVDPVRAHQLRGNMAEGQKDYATAENEYKQAVAAAGARPAVAWNELAGFYARRQRYAEMEQAMRKVMNAATRESSIQETSDHDRRAGVALYDSAGLLMETHRDPALAATLLGDYLDSPAKTEEAPAFIAHFRLAQLKKQLGDSAASERERKAALALAQEFKPARDFKPTRESLEPDPQQARN